MLIARACFFEFRICTAFGLQYIAMKVFPQTGGKSVMKMLDLVCLVFSPWLNSVFGAFANCRMDLAWIVCESVR